MGKSYTGAIQITPQVSVKAIRCNGLHPCMEIGAQDTIWMMTCAPMSVSEDLKVLIKKALIKICPPALVPKECEALQFRLVSGETNTHGGYLALGLSMHSDRHMCLRDILLF